MTRFRIRGVEAKDHKDLLLVAKHLNSVNLPENDEAVSGIIDHSVQSFLGKLPSKKAEYVFALEEIATGRIVGTSMVIGQLGRRDAPYIYFDVRSEEKYSNSLDRHFHHTVLRIGYSYDGPTEIGGIVVLPEFRMGSERLGQFLSYVRFLFIAMHRRLFRERVLAELMPPLLKDGRSLLWESIGKKFTGLDYREADKLSRRNKEFIKELFPSSDLYASLFPERAQKLIGEVGADTRGVKRMLERIGFKYVNHIDPFDGGPHYEADVKDISLIRRHRTARLSSEDFELDEGDDMMVGKEKASGKNRFRAVRCLVRIEDQVVQLPARAKELLEARPGDKLSLIPFE